MHACQSSEHISKPLIVFVVVYIATFGQSLGSINPNAMADDRGWGEVEHLRNVLEGLLHLSYLGFQRILPLMFCRYFTCMHAVKDRIVANK